MMILPEGPDRPLRDSPTQRASDGTAGPFQGRGRRRYAPRWLALGLTSRKKRLLAHSDGGRLESWWNLCSRFADLEADCERPGGRNWLCRIDRERVRDRRIRDGRAAQPVRLRSSVSWAIQVFSRDGPGSSPSVFSS